MLIGYGIILLGIAMFVVGAVAYHKNQDIQLFETSSKNRFLTFAYGHIVILGLLMMLFGGIVAGIIPIN